MKRSGIELHVPAGRRSPSPEIFNKISKKLDCIPVIYFKIPAYSDRELLRGEAGKHLSFSKMNMKKGGVGLNTKQVEELTGMSRQNIRYYERMGLLEPAREDGNAYRDYSQEDIRRLKLIKMLRMLDMPLKEIENIINGKASLKDTVKQQRENLQVHQKQLQAAIEVCASIGRDKEEHLDVDSYLSRMETMERNGGVFARFVDDYKQVAREEQERKFCFYADFPVNTPGMFEKALEKYASEQGLEFRMMKKGRYPEFMLGNSCYTAVRVLEKKKDDERAAARIICERKEQGAGSAPIPVKRKRLLRGIHILAVNIRRHRRRSLLNLGVSALTVIVLSFYLGNIGSMQRLLKEAPESFDISGEIWNMRGELNHGLFISHQVLEDLYQSERIEEIAESAELMGSMAGAADHAEEADIPDPISLLGINRLECMEGMGEEDITWESGKDWDTFLKNSSDCIVSEAFAKEKGISPGDTAEFDLARYSQGLAGVILERQELMPEAFHIAGIYKVEEERDGGNPDVLLPLDTVKKIYEKNDIVYFASALSFQVTNPMELNEVKQELKAAGLKEILYGSPNSYVGIGVKLTDTEFIHSMESADRSLALLKNFLPFVFLIVAVAGYIIPSLLLQNRREEYAVMRALGTGKHFCSLLFYIEHIVPAIAGALIGAAAGAIGGAVNIISAAVVLGLYLIFYMLGAAAALWRFGRFSIAAVLSHRD